MARDIILTEDHDGYSKWSQLTVSNKKFAELTELGVCKEHVRATALTAPHVEPTQQDLDMAEMAASYPEPAAKKSRNKSKK